MAFNAQEILNKTVTESDGKKAMVAEGTYENCTIGEIVAHEPGEWGKEKNVEARLHISYDCNNFDGDLSHFVNYKSSLHPKSTLAKLMKAVWPDESERKTKSTADLEGQSVNVSVFHEDSKIDGRAVTYPEFRFTRVDS